MGQLYEYDSIIQDKMTGRDCKEINAEGRKNKMKTWEILKLAYEGKHEDRAIRSKDGTYWIKGKHISSEKDKCSPCEHTHASTEWELIPQSVPFMEAMATYGTGAMYISCVRNGQQKVYGGVQFTDIKNNVPVTFDEILNGQWYIGDGEQP